MYKKYIKRVLDIILATIALLFALPVTLFIAIAIKLDDGGPVFFKHKRYGQNKQPFTIYKFRTMRVDAPPECPTNSLDNHQQHIMRTGAIMRKLSLDELPQLINVLRGEMSLVGPRPVILAETDLIAERDKYDANSCKPGITGWAQVSGRDELRMKVKARMDGEYVKNLGLWMDLRCLALTIFAVLSMKGHREGGKATTTTQHNSSTNTNPVDQPLVSIIIPVYNAEKYIAEAIQSVINQTYTNWELLLVDDCSDDKSVDISKHYTNNDDRIKLLFLDTNSGPAIARNFGIDTARGRYIAFLDADDKWDKNKLSIQVQFMLDKGCAFSFTSYEFANAECIPNGKKVHVPKEITYEQALRNTPISTITVMLDISILSREDVAMPQVTTGEDTATWWKILKKVKLAYGIDCVLSYYRRSFHTLSSNKVLAMKRRWILYRELEKLSLAHSTYNFIHYCYYAAKRRV